MEKALLDHFYVIMTDKNGNTDGKPPMKYDRKFSSFLIEGANQHIIQLKDRDQVQLAHDEFIFWCMNEYFQSGTSPALLNTLNKNICFIAHQCQVISSKKKLIAIFVAHIPHKPPPKMFAAYMFSNMTSLGWLEGLKRCQSQECQQFFIGRPNVKWCSKTCGSRSRVKKMRKKNRSG